MRTYRIRTIPVILIIVLTWAMPLVRTSPWRRSWLRRQFTVLHQENPVLGLVLVLGVEVGVVLRRRVAILYHNKAPATVTDSRREKEESLIALARLSMKL